MNTQSEDGNQQPRGLRGNIGAPSTVTGEARDPASCSSCLSLQARLEKAEQERDGTLLEICRRIEACAAPAASSDGLYDCRELSEARQLVLAAVYALAESALAEAAESRLTAPARLVEAVRSFLEKWPKVEKRVNGMIGLQFARSGVQYDGPNIGAEIEAMKAQVDRLTACVTPQQEETKEVTRMDTMGNATDNPTASSVQQGPTNEPPFVDTPVLAAKRRAFDNPTQANLDALIAAVKAAGWQPIATAPKDGTMLLLFRVVSPWRVVGYGKWIDDFGIAGWLAYGFNDPPGNLGLADPTHWMPLPEPPQ